jgi:hypothetical protein
MFSHWLMFMACCEQQLMQSFSHMMHGLSVHAAVAASLRCACASDSKRMQLNMCV